MTGTPALELHFWGLSANATGHEGVIAAAMIALAFIIARRLR